MKKRLPRIKWPLLLQVDSKGVLHLPGKLVDWIIIKNNLQNKTDRAQKMAIKRLIIDGIKRGMSDGLKAPGKTKKAL